jgi:hypothetical protein
MKIKPLIVFMILVYHFFEEQDTTSPEPKAVFGGRIPATSPAHRNRRGLCQ